MIIYLHLDHRYDPIEIVQSIFSLSTIANAYAWLYNEEINQMQLKYSVFLFIDQASCSP